MSEFVAKVSRGIRRALPSDPDTRQAFLLLDCRPPRTFGDPRSPADFKLKLAALLGFFGMLRFSAIAQLTPQKIMLVSPCGQEVPLSRVHAMAARSLQSTFIGFYFRFRGKSTGPPFKWLISPRYATSTQTSSPSALSYARA